MITATAKVEIPEDCIDADRQPARFVIHRNGKDAHKYLELTDDFYRKVDDFGFVVLIEKGTKSDGASIPKWAWLLVGQPFDGQFLEAALAHDVLCHRSWIKKDYNLRVIADSVFFYFLQRDGVPYWKRAVMYAAVRFWGRFSYWWRLKEAQSESIKGAAMIRILLLIFWLSSAANAQTVRVSGTSQQLVRSNCNQQRCDLSPSPVMHYGNGTVIAKFTNTESDLAILTAYHVIVGCSDIRINSASLKNLPAKVVRYDASLDVALLRVTKPSPYTGKYGMLSRTVPGEGAPVILATYDGGIGQFTRKPGTVISGGRIFNVTLGNAPQGSAMALKIASRSGDSGAGVYIPRSLTYVGMLQADGTALKSTVISEWLEASGFFNFDSASEDKPADRQPPTPRTDARVDDLAGRLDQHDEALAIIAELLKDRPRQGPKGEPGERGPQGDQGPTGERGPQGPAGTSAENEKLAELEKRIEALEPLLNRRLILMDSNNQITSDREYKPDQPFVIKGLIRGNK